MPSSDNGLKVCSFNAKCDELDYKCCIKDACFENKCGRANKIPDSLVAAMIAVTILPSRADIYNIQNVRNKCVVEHLVKEIVRVKDITDELDEDDCSCMDPAFILDIACRLNSFDFLCPDAVAVKDALASCKICNLDYVDASASAVVNCDSRQITASVLRYKNVSEYNAYYNGTCLTLVKKSLCLCPETHGIPCVDSLVLFFEYNEKRFINVNVNLGDLVNSFDDLGCKKEKVDSIICFLRKYQDCGAVLMTGAFGDLDYDTRQLFFQGDAKIPEIAQRMLANGVSESPVPSDFPCDLNDPVYEVMEFLLKTCNAETIPYTWLLQYLRLKGCKKCCLYKLVCKDSSKCGKSCRSLCRPCAPKSCAPCVAPCKEERKGHNGSDLHLQLGTSNRSHLRNVLRKTDKHSSNHSSSRSEHSRSEHSRSEHSHSEHSDADGSTVGSDKGTFKSFSHGNFGGPGCEKDCVVAEKCCCEPKCFKVCVDNCPVKYKSCEHCNADKCEIRCKEQYECECDQSKHLVRVNICKDLCKKENKCEENVCPPDSCDGFKYCDTLTVLKKELCLYNSLNKIEDINNRYTGFYDHFNRCIDCKYPRGMFQAWAMCEEYEKPRKTSRVIDNNSELLALDHFLVSECLKNNITCASLSDLCIEKCGKSVNSLICHKDLKHFNSIRKNPFVISGLGCPVGSSALSIGGVSVVPEDNQFVFEYGGSVVRSFFTHRVYCVNFEFPHKNKGCEVDCGESLHGLGLTSLWSVLCRFGCDSVDIGVFERFGLDAHPYFRDFFWKTYPRRFLTTDHGNMDPVNKLASRFGECDNNALVSIQKRHSICEEDFYKHLLCVFSNTENRDQFVLTISFMEALYRVDKMKNLLDCKEAKLLSDRCLVENLFRFLSKCFVENPKLTDFLSHQGELGKLLEGQCAKSKHSALISVDYNKIYCLVNALSFSLKDNCLLMEILCRHAARSLVYGGCRGCCTFVQPCDKKAVERGIKCLLNFLNLGCDDDRLVCIFRDLVCGANPKHIVTELVEEVDEHLVITVLFYLISMPLCDFFRKCD